MARCIAARQPTLPTITRSTTDSAAPGSRLVSFAPILKHAVFPLAPLLDHLTKIGEDALGRPVEIEFAARLPQKPGESADFGFLQIRPLVLSREGEELRLDEVDPERLVCQSSKVLGNGRIADLRDVVVVDFHRFERARSKEVARGVAHFNAKLNAEGSTLFTDRRGPMGIAPSLARDSGRVGSDFRGAGDCRGWVQ